MNKLIFRICNIINTICMGAKAIINRPKSKIINNARLYSTRNVGNENYTKKKVMESAPLHSTNNVGSRKYTNTKNK